MCVAMYMERSESFFFFNAISLQGIAEDGQETQTDKPVPPPVVHGLGWDASREAAGLILDDQYEVEMFDSECSKISIQLQAGIVDSITCTGLKCWTLRL